MDGFLYDDLENEQKSIRRLALTEESLNRTLLHDETNNRNNNCLLIYVLAGSIIAMVIILLIVAYKHLI